MRFNRDFYGHPRDPIVQDVPQFYCKPRIPAGPRTESTSPRSLNLDKDQDNTHFEPFMIESTGVFGEYATLSPYKRHSGQDNTRECAKVSTGLQYPSQSKQRSRRLLKVLRE